MCFQGPGNTDVFLTFTNTPCSKRTLVVQGLEWELLLSQMSQVTPFGNIVYHQIYPLISWIVYFKSQSLLAAVLSHTVSLWGSQVPYKGSDTRATNRLLLPTYTQLKIIVKKVLTSLQPSNLSSGLKWDASNKHHLPPRKADLSACGWLRCKL